MPEEPDIGRETELDDEGLDALVQALVTAPPRELRARVLGAVEQAASLERAARGVRRWRASTLAAGAIAAALALIVGQGALESGEAARELAALQKERVELDARIEAQQRDRTLLEDAVRAQSEMARILTAPQFITASLRPLSGGEGLVRVLLDPASGAVAVVGSGLPPPDAGRVYELWAIRGGSPPESAGALSPSGEPSFAVRLREVADPREVTEFAISLEPEGGAGQPTGPVVLAGAIDR
jgi:hypothetical protein